MKNVPVFIQKMAQTASSFSGLAQVALEQLQTFPDKAEIVCGPISTGGLGKSYVNLLIFNHVIEVLQSAGRPIWSQMPFEAGLAELEHEWKAQHPHEAYCKPILDEFYLPIFESGYIRTAWFIDGEHGWTTSQGAQWEMAQCKRLSIPQRFFAEVWHVSIPDLRETCLCDT